LDRHTISFVLLAGIIYAALHFAYHKVPDDYLRKTVYPNVIGHTAVNIINTATPDRNASVNDNRILSGNTILNTRLPEIISGLILGSLAVYLINQTRIIGLFYLVEWRRELFPVVHTYFAPTLIILLVAGFFLWWTQWAIDRWTKRGNTD